MIGLETQNIYSWLKGCFKCVIPQAHRDAVTFSMFPLSPMDYDVPSHNFKSQFNSIPLFWVV
jgi:hypothetical protein